jgi:hypothetical protein
MKCGIAKVLLNVHPTSRIKNVANKKKALFTVFQE